MIKCACVLIHNIQSSGLAQEEINGKVRCKLYSIIKVNNRCLYGCAPPGQGAAAVCGIKEIVVYPLPVQLQDSFRVLCLFSSTIWGIRNLTVKELESAMDKPQENAS